MIENEGGTRRVVKRRRATERRLRLGFVAALLAPFVGLSCLPADTRPPPGSIFLTVTSADDPSVTTVDGWSIAMGRLLVGIGEASLGEYRESARRPSEYKCRRYSEANYMRLLDGRLPTDQKVSIVYGLGQCDLSFFVTWPSPDTLLGEGVNDTDKELMESREVPVPGQHQAGIAVDFAATATRGPETKRVHWMFRQITSYGNCVRTVADASSQSIELQGDVNLTLHIGVRGAALFGDDANPTTAMLRFDAIAGADTIYGNGDGEVTLDELGEVPLDVARQSGPYGVGSITRSVPRTLEDYMHLVLFPRLVQFRQDFACDILDFSPPPPPPG